MFETAFKSEINDQQLADTYWNEIAEKYTAKNRHYHTLDHLDFIYTHLLPVKPRILDWTSIIFSIAYHDFEYDTMRSDNEDRSADIAAKRLSHAGFLTEVIRNCKMNILATQHHEMAPDSDTNYFTDADLAILGSLKSAYDYYVEDIRREYSNIPDELFRKGRVNVLKYYLDMPFIFKTEFFREKYEAQARDNIQREIGYLTKSS